MKRELLVRLLIILFAFPLATLACAGALAGILELDSAVFMFLGALVIYVEYVNNTYKLYKLIGGTR